jgi:hypothetical protein
MHINLKLKYKLYNTMPSVLHVTNNEDIHTLREVGVFSLSYKSKLFFLQSTSFFFHTFWDVFRKAAVHRNLNTRDNLLNLYQCDQYKARSTNRSVPSDYRLRCIQFSQCAYFGNTHLCCLFIGLHLKLFSQYLIWKDLSLLTDYGLHCTLIKMLMYEYSPKKMTGLSKLKDGQVYSRCITYHLLFFHQTGNCLFEKKERLMSHINYVNLGANTVPYS